MADDHVIFENSTRLMTALQAKATPFESMLYPGLRHRAGWTQANLLHRTRTSLDYGRNAHGRRSRATTNI
jgi:dipeptidyl-peptidase-4